MSTAVSQRHSEAVRPRRFVIMGVSGCGKSSVGAALAYRLSGIYIDGDDLHPAANVAKMSAGVPLTDADRWPWLNSVGDCLAQAEETVLIGCSALKQTYRDKIRAAVEGRVRFIHLAGKKEVIAARLQTRQGHFMPAALLESQFASLEPPGPAEQAITVDIDQPFDAVIAAIIAALEEEEL
ncbi:gluconokinase [Rhizobium sp. NXC24]|uniref:gluconokinase n=1 Tax=Rhizobium sp. NXC24 TaxID=2048897 RepID=UPI000CF2E9AB|nr:gluconokinase [Rhizobium sp. NXC24]